MSIGRIAQAELFEMPRLDKIDLPRWKADDVRKACPAVQDAEEIKKLHKKTSDKVMAEASFYAFALNHPELCPPVGTVFYMKNTYGVKAKVVVDMVLNGLPGTYVEILPPHEQPEHLRDKTFLEIQSRSAGKPGFTCWPDVVCWNWHQANNGPLGFTPEG